MWSSAHFSVAYRPVSQMVTDPPPYSPAVIVPANAAYSSGWSSVGTASRLGPSPSEGPSAPPSSSGRRRAPAGDPSARAHPCGRVACGAPGPRRCRRCPPAAHCRRVERARRSVPDPAWRGTRRAGPAPDLVGRRTRQALRRARLAGGLSAAFFAAGAFFAVVLVAAVLVAAGAFAAGFSAAAFLAGVFFAGAFFAGARLAGAVTAGASSSASSSVA